MVEVQQPRMSMDKGLRAALTGSGSPCGGKDRPPELLAGIGAICHAR